MALKPCRECKKKVSTEANTCPNCGVPNPTLELEGLEDLINSTKDSKKKSENIYEDIWLFAKDANHLVDSTFMYVNAPLDKESSYRIFSIMGYFQRGIFEASCEHHKLDKKDFKKAIIYCFSQKLDSHDFDKFSNEKKDSLAEETYQNLEVGLRHDDRVGKMCQRIIDTGKKSFKSDGSGCFAQLTGLWKDKNIYFSESALRRDVGRFFKKLF